VTCIKAERHRIRLPEPPASPPRHPLAREQRQHAPSIDGVSRLAAFRRIEGQLLLASFALAEGYYLGPWYTHLVWMAAFALLTALALLWTSSLVRLEKPWSSMWGSAKRAPFGWGRRSAGRHRQDRLLRANFRFLRTIRDLRARVNSEVEERRFADSSLEGTGFRTCMGFSLSSGVFGLLPVLYSERQVAILHPVACDQVPGARAMKSRDRNASKAWRLAA